MFEPLNDALDMIYFEKKKKKRQSKGSWRPTTIKHSLYFADVV